MRRRAQSGQQPRGAASTTPNPLPAPSPRPSPARAPSPSSPRFPLQSSPGSPTPPALYRWAARGETQERPDDHKPTYRLRVYGVEDPLQTPRQCSRAPSTGVLQGRPELTSQLALSDTGIKSTTRGCRSLPPPTKRDKAHPGTALRVGHLSQRPHRPWLTTVLASNPHPTASPLPRATASRISTAFTPASATLSWPVPPFPAGWAPPPQLLPSPTPARRP